jgi:signal transduction histidine kinase
VRVHRGDSEQLRRLLSVTDAALAHLELDELLPALLERARDAVDADTCAILLLDEAAGELVTRAAVGVEGAVDVGVRMRFGHGFAGRIAAEQRPIVVDDVDHADVNPILHEQGIKSLLGVPLLVEGASAGVLHVGTLERREFTQDDVELLRRVADRAAIAIERVRLFESERRARMRLEHVQAVTDAALGHLALDELLPKLLARIRDILEVDTAAVLLLDEDTDELVARAALGLEEEVEQGVRIPVGRGFAGRIAAEQRPIVLDDLEHADILNPLLRQKGLASILGIPLTVEDERIGVLHVGSLTPRIFTPDETELLQLVGERVALAIERARLHERIVEVDQMKLNFVAVASHELRTPATSIYGALATLRGLDLPPETRTVLEDTLWEQTLRLRRLIEQLLDLSRLDADAINVHPQPIVLRSVLREILAGVSESVKPETILLDVDPSLAVIADPLVLDRVVSNLVGNACRYGKTPVTVRAVQTDTYIRVSVEDKGEGIPAELVPRLFDRFERGTGGQGSGLGLAIAKAYARAHGGDVVYEPRASGARFELMIPTSSKSRATG